MEYRLRVLGIDPATKTGWALWASGSIVASGTWDLSVRRDESGGMRLIRLRAKLAELLNAEGFTVLAYEAARHGAPQMQGALVVHSELQGVIKLWCEDLRIDYRGYSPSEVKKAATGEGNANKAAMLEAARRAWPGFAGDDNEADARFIARLAGEQLKARSAAA